MDAALPTPTAYGRVAKEGVVRRALSRWVFIAAIVAGGVLIAQSLYIPVKAQVAQVLLAEAFDEGLATRTPVKPWNWADTAPIARVSAPRLRESEIVLSGGSGEAMAFGPTALIDDRSKGMTVLAAHRDTHFEFVQHLLIGDDVWLERIDGSTANFRVARVEIVRWDEFSHPTDGRVQGVTGMIALTTCYPFDSDEAGPLRYVVWAHAHPDN
ncbi:class GN sortase [Erythrobacter sp. Alg231-14]|uniref:class GN sortase n=1 Tax=Erythrobacter sp. Alg231-14 TaxID=1922225 RepID=UPI000D5572B8